MTSVGKFSHTGQQRCLTEILARFRRIKCKLVPQALSFSAAVSTVAYQAVKLRKLVAKAKETRGRSRQLKRMCLDKN